MNGIDLMSTIDWLSVKLTGASIVLVSITGGTLMIILGVAATATTVIYNLIRIYKELKNKKQK